MTKYEAPVAFSVKNGEEQSKALAERFETLISENANLLKVDAWGVRRLAYEINYEREAAYYLYTFECEEDFPAELERVFGITDGILRWLIVKAVDVETPITVEEAPEEEAAEDETVEETVEFEAEETEDEAVEETVEFEAEEADEETEEETADEAEEESAE
jgi:small subunit ribosomal protein S6